MSKANIASSRKHLGKNANVTKGYRRHARERKLIKPRESLPESTDSRKRFEKTTSTNTPHQAKTKGGKVFCFCENVFLKCLLYVYIDHHVYVDTDLVYE